MPAMLTSRLRPRLTVARSHDSSHPTAASDDLMRYLLLFRASRHTAITSRRVDAEHTAL